MPIMSFLAYPMDGQKEALRQALEALDGCDTVPAANQDVLVLVTDTADREADEALRARIREIPALQCLTLVAAYSDQEASAMQ